MEVSFAKEIEMLRLGAGETFHGEGILAITKAVLQAGDVPRTWASDELLRALVGALPRTALDEGVGAFVRWYRDWAGV